MVIALLMCSSALKLHFLETWFLRGVSCTNMLFQEFLSSAFVQGMIDTHKCVTLCTKMKNWDDCNLRGLFWNDKICDTFSVWTEGVNYDFMTRAQHF